MADIFRTTFSFILRFQFHYCPKGPNENDAALSTFPRTSDKLLSEPIFDPVHQASPGIQVPVIAILSATKGKVPIMHWHTGLILGLRSTNERRRYFVTTSPIDWTGCKPRISPDVSGHRMMTSWNGDTFPNTGPLCEKSTGHRGMKMLLKRPILFWCFLYIEQTAVLLVI